MTIENRKPRIGLIAAALTAALATAPAGAQDDDECLAIIGMASASACETGFCGELRSNRGLATVDSIVDESASNPVQILPDGTQKVRVLQTITFTDGDYAGLSYVTSDKFVCRVVDPAMPDICRSASKANVVGDDTGVWGRFNSRGYGDFSELPFMEWFYEGEICGL